VMQPSRSQLMMPSMPTGMSMGGLSGMGGSSGMGGMGSASGSLGATMPAGMSMPTMPLPASSVQNKLNSPPGF
jgi:hypothetical protein